MPCCKHTTMDLLQANPTPRLCACIRLLLLPVLMLQAGGACAVLATVCFPPHKCSMGRGSVSSPAALATGHTGRL